MSSNKLLRHSIRLAMAGGVTAALAAPTAIAQDDEDEEARELDRVQVTGTRISRADIEGALPVTTIDREAIELSGEANAADLIRNLSFNTQGAPRPESGTTAAGFAGANLRGLGSSRTLVLIDGRRMPESPELGSSNNLNQIPMAAVDRIEILSDGASAVYGSDAIGGVINIITRSDFTGVEAMYGRSWPAREGGDTEEGSILMGHEGTRGSLMAGVNYSQRDIVWQRDREWSRGGASIFSNNMYQQPVPGVDPVQHPEFGSAVPGGCEGDSWTIQPGTDEYGFQDDSAGQCLYDFTALAADEAKNTTSSLFVRGNYEINMDWDLYMNSQVDRVQSFGRYAPVPSSPWPGGLPTASPGDPNHPATPAGLGGLNPNYQDDTYQDLAGQDVFIAHRFDALGPRDSFGESTVYDLDVGAEGRIGDWDLDFGMRHNEYRFVDLGKNYVVGELAQNFIDSGDYNMYDPYAVEEDVANQMINTISRDTFFEMQEIHGAAATDIGMLPAGPVQMVVGGEYREEDYQDEFDPLQESGQIVGSAGSSAAGDREAMAVFSEVLIPVLDDLELDIAARYDEYSDYGSDVSPKIAFRYQPMDELTLRGSYGEGFRAPPLSVLAAEPAFSAAGVVDPPTAQVLGVDPGQEVQITTYSIANPELESENSEQFSLGAAFQPTEWLNGSLDYYNIQITNQITGVSAQQIINCIDGDEEVCPPDLSDWNEEGVDAGPDPDPSLGLGRLRGPDGNVTFAQTGSTNLGEIETDGLDLNLRTSFDLGEWGRVGQTLQWSHVMSFEVDGNDVVGNVGNPENRGSLQNQWAYSDFQVSFNIDYIDYQSTTADTQDDGATPSWTTYNLQGNWYAPWDGRITVGVRNLTDEDPPLDAGFGRGFNFDLYDGYGRQPYVRYTQSF